MLIDRLEELVSIVRELDRPVVSLLLPGVSAQKVDDALGAPAPAAVVAWFGWCDGVRSRPGQIQDDVNLVPGYSPLSLAEALAARSTHAGDPVLVGPQWIPLLGGPSGDLYAAVWEKGSEPRVAGVLIGEPTEIEFDSVEQMVNFFVRCYREGAYAVGDDNHLTMDPDRCDEIYADIVGG